MASSEVPVPSDDELRRIRDLLRTVGGQNVQWGAQQVLDTWVIEQRMRADRMAARRLVAATWVLAIATVGLVLATVGLIFATVSD